MSAETQPDEDAAGYEHRPAPTKSADDRSAGRRAPKRINVAVAPETVRALEFLIEREQVSLTEAVRRLVGYGDFIYREMKENGAEVLVRDKSSTREVVLL